MMEAAYPYLQWKVDNVVRNCAFDKLLKLMCAAMPEDHYFPGCVQSILLHVNTWVVIHCVNTAVTCIFATVSHTICTCRSYYLMKGIMQINLSDEFEHHCWETSNCPHKFADCKREKWRDIADELCPLYCAPRFI
jgi:hypothetical protein